MQEHNLKLSSVPAAQLRLNVLVGVCVCVDTRADVGSYTLASTLCDCRLSYVANGESACSYATVDGDSFNTQHSAAAAASSTCA
jgi:hypothetical protein